jgi:hypothetical protein
VLEGCKAGRLSDVRVYVEGTEDFNVETSKLKNRASKLDAEQLSMHIVREEDQISRAEAKTK